jgi:(1->4)-alpha-D-glucan 1-alpha-D-glucosylmutase
MIPRATMRLQLHKEFTFHDAMAVIPYLVDLGISHVYVSPILKARAGSMHGYDVVDPTLVNPELGGETGYRDFVGQSRQAGLGIIVDIVPNHMAVGGADNPWWTDLLRFGRSSKYAEFFDVDWDTADPDLRGKVLAPFLGRSYGDALEAGEIKLGYAEPDVPVVQYYDSAFPIDPVDYEQIARLGLEAFDPSTPSGRAALHELLERQHYRLAWWGAAGDEINWRRFFDINGLAGLRIELREVFEATHTTLFRLYADGLIDGFRIDHVDGLSDPPGYCRRLRQRLDELAADRHAYIVVEKILGAGERLPTDWGIDGTSGYDFMNEVSAVQHDASSADALGRVWQRLTQRSADFEDEEVAARGEILLGGFDAQLQAVTAALHRIARADTTTRDLSAARIRAGLVALLAHFPVYRGYDAGEKRSAEDARAFAKALAAAKESSPSSLHPVLDQLDRWLGGEPGDKGAVTRFQQLSAPVAAKSVEDTAFYRYGRLLSRNDVGFDAGRFGCSVEAFHAASAQRLASFPHAMLATATHDHKRGEDLRARLAVISEIPDEWGAFLAECRAVAAERPDPGDESMLYQMIIGSWPLDMDPQDQAGREALRERLAQWQQKALREAKLRTGWTAPNGAYETLAAKFLEAALDPRGDLLPLLVGFARKIGAAGAVNGLAQTLLKLTVPGMPDFFQGTEFWDFSLVDPDNRRPVDYDLRRRTLAAHAKPWEAQRSWRDGQVKQSLIAAMLGLRSRMPALFADGDYVPLAVEGAMQPHVIAFARSHRNAALIVVAPRLIWHFLSDADRLVLDPRHLRDSRLLIPQALAERRFCPLLAGGEAIALGRNLPLDRLLSGFPMSVFYQIDSA